MVALPDTYMPDAPVKHLNTPTQIEESRGAMTLKRGLLAGFGVGTLLAALGVWIVPVDEGDTAMQLVKLVFSGSMLVMCMLFISALDSSNAEPEIQLDPSNRQLRIVKRDSRGNALVQGSYNLDELSDITLKDRHLSARDAKGEEIVSIPVRNAAAEQAIRAALSEVA